jgi:hypothetical protein
MEFGKVWVNWIFGGIVRRRGTDVNIPKIGSRDGVFVPWGNLGFYAVLRRELEWGFYFWVGFGGYGR